MAYSDGVDSHYQYVRSRIHDKNPQRLVAGLLGAQDWPPKQIKTQAFYLLDLGDVPAAKTTYSANILTVVQLFQWVWIIEGSPTAANVQANYRGDRFRLNQAMKDEMVYALYPYFTEKKSWALSATGVWVGTSKDPAEHFYWTEPEFKQNADKRSGLVYGSASVHVVNMLDNVSA